MTTAPAQLPAPVREETRDGDAGRRRLPLFERAILKRAVADSFAKLDPRVEVRNPIMFVVLVGSVWTTILFVRDLGRVSTSTSVFGGLVALWLWFTVLFANFAEAVAEGRGRRKQTRCEGRDRRRSATSANPMARPSMSLPPSWPSATKWWWPPASSSRATAT